MPARLFAQADPGLLARRGLVCVLVLGAMAGVMLLGWDQPLREALGRFGKSAFGHAWGVSAYWMGLGGVQVAGAAALIALAIWARSLRWRGIGIGCLWAVAVSGIMVQVIKHLVGRARPRTGLAADMLVGLTMNSDMHSFPSGHTATSFALAAWLTSRCPPLRGGILWAGCFYLPGPHDQRVALCQRRVGRHGSGPDGGLGS